MMEYRFPLPCYQPYDGNGNFTVDQPAFNPNTTISSSAVNSNNTDFANGLTDCITKDGQSTPTAVIPLHVDGINYASDPDTGLHLTAANTQALKCGNVDVLFASTTGVTVTVTFGPNTSDGAALGSASLQWSDLFLASGGAINFANGDVTITHAVNGLTFAGASSGYLFDAAVVIAAGGFTVTAGAVSFPAGAINSGALNANVFATQAQQEAGSSTAVAVSPGRQQSHLSAAKAWAQVQVSGGVATLLTGYNISSVVRNSLGDFTLNFTTPFSSTAYCAIAQYYGIDSSVQAGPTANVKSQTAGAARVETLTATSSSNTTSIAQDLSFMFVAYGDQ